LGRYCRVSQDSPKEKYPRALKVRECMTDNESEQHDDCAEAFERACDLAEELTDEGRVLFLGRRPVMRFQHRAYRHGRTHKARDCPFASMTLKPAAMVSTVHCAGKRRIGRFKRLVFTRGDRAPA
jgi:hypothetical protein